MILALCVSFLMVADPPDWVKSYGTSSRYPERTHLTGFGLQQQSESMDAATAQRLAIDNARSNLIEKIRVRLQSTVSTLVEEKGRTVSEYASAAVQSSSTMELEGLETATYVDEDEKMFFALAYISRSKLASLYADKVQNFTRSIEGHIAAAKNFEQGGNPAKALEEYFACLPLFRDLDEARTVVAVSRTTADAAFAELNGTTAAATKSPDVAEVREAITRIVQRPLKNLDDLSWFIAYSLSKQSKEQSFRVLVAPFTYQDTKMGSAFSRFFREALEQKIGDVAKWQAVRQASDVNPTSANVTRDFASASGAEYVLSGTYWERPEGIKFLVTVRAITGGTVVGSAEAVVTPAVLEESRLSIKPENFKEAFSAQKAFAKNEVMGGGLELEAWTNKGTEDLLFTKGEKMNVFIRVNVPSYIRFIYHLADGKRVLLLDNYYIDESKVNKTYQIPEEFECSEPFGAEFLQVFASTEQFDKLGTVSQDGYEYLKEDLAKVLVASRGMKKAAKPAMKAETRLTITTMDEQK